jgi:hypothetical protein
MMHQRAAAAGVRRHFHIHAAAGEQADGGVVDLRSQHLLGAAGEQDHPFAAFAGRGGRAGTAESPAAQQTRWRQVEHRHQFLGRDPAQQAGERACEARGPERDTEARRIGQRRRQQPADRAVLEAAPAGRVDMCARVVDEMHVVDPARTGRHARQAGQAAVDVPAHDRRGAAAALEHFLHQVDAPARAVAFVAEQDVGWAGGRAEPAMHAFSQDAVNLRGARVLELLGLEVGLHGAPVLPSEVCPQKLGYMRPGLRTPAGSNAVLSLRESFSSPGSSG